MAKSENYYYNMLSQKSKAIYTQMQKGIEAFQPSFAVPIREGNELVDIFTFLRLDHPEIIATDRFTYSYFKDSNHVQITPQYMFEKDKLKMHTNALQSRITKLTRPYLNSSELEKEKFVHDFICQNVKYDALKKQYSHEIIGPLANGVGVCEGIAKTVKALYDALGIWCIVVLCHNNPEQNITYRHAWNVIKINGKFYHLDATFDNSLSKQGILRYDYFNLCDKQIFRDHEKLIYTAPICNNNSDFYYNTQKLSFTKIENIANRISQSAKKGKTFIFHWRGGYFTKDIVSELINVIKRESDSKNKTPVISINWAQSVVKIDFTDKQNEYTDFELENANDGEKYDIDDSKRIF